MNRKGFTMIELILVIAILGLLAVSALPKFLDLSTQASNASMNGVIGAVRSGVALYKANLVANGSTGIYPTTLDAPASTCCFNNILESPVSTSQGWSISAANVYVYNKNGVNSTLTYTSGSGVFE